MMETIGAIYYYDFYKKQAETCEALPLRDSDAHGRAQLELRILAAVQSGLGSGGLRVGLLGLGPCDPLRALGLGF